VPPAAPDSSPSICRWVGLRPDSSICSSPLSSSCSVIVPPFLKTTKAPRRRLRQELGGLHAAAGLLSTFGAAAHTAAGLLSTFGAAAFLAAAFLAAALLAAALLAFLAFLLPFGHSFPPWGWLVGTTFPPGSGRQT